MFNLVSIVAAVDGNTGGIFNDTAVRELLAVVAGILVMVVGAGVIGASKRARYGEVAQTSLNSLVGLFLVAIGFGAVGVVTFGTKIANWLGL